MFLQVSVKWLDIEHKEKIEHHLYNIQQYIWLQKVPKGKREEETCDVESLTFWPVSYGQPNEV